MNITKENTGDYTASLSIELQPEDFMPKVNEELEKIRKKATFPGFRPGKAPLGLIKRHYGKTTILEEIHNLAFESVYKYIDEEKLKIIGKPLINTEKTPKIEDLTETQSYNFVFDIGLVPEFDVNISPDVVVTYKKVSVTDETLDKEIQSLRERYASFDTSDSITDDCMVTGNLSISESATDQPNETNNNSFFRYFLLNKLDKNPKIQEKFIGKKTGDIIEISPSDIEDKESITFFLPESVDLEKEGLNIQFKVSESYISKPAELNTEFFSKVFGGRQIADEETFRQMLKDELEHHYKMQCDDIFLNEVKKKLLSETQLPLPKDFVKRFLIENNKEKSENEDKLNDLEERFDEYLEMIKWEFIQDKLFTKFNVSITIDDFKEYLRNFYRDYMKQTDISDEQLNRDLQELLKDQKRMDNIEASIRKNKLKSLLMSNLTINEVEYPTFQALLEEEKNQKNTEVEGKSQKNKKTTKKVKE